VEKIMNNFLKSLSQELLKLNLYQSEIDEIIAYYEEIITDRYENGEDMDHIIASYDIRSICRAVLPQALQRRNPGSNKEVGQNIKTLVIFLFSIPFLIPVGIVYLAFIITIFILMLTGAIVTGSSIIGFVVLLVQIFQGSLEIGTILATIGLYLFGMSLAIILIYYIGYGFLYVLNGSVKLVSRIVSGGQKNETIY